MSNYTLEEKIDFIFKELKYQKKTRLYKLIIKLIFIGSIIIIYFSFIQWLDKDKLIKDFSSQIAEIVTPITKNIVSEMVNDNTPNVKNIWQWLIDDIKNNPNIFDNF